MAETIQDIAQPDEDAPRLPKNLSFMVVDDYADGRFLVAKTLMRKFPHCAVVECQTAEAAFAILEKQQSPHLIVAHRTVEFDGLSLVRELRARAPNTPILMSSGIDRQDAAVKAGADAFITYDEWLLVGNRVLELLVRGRAGTNPPLA